MITLFLDTCSSKVILGLVEDNTVLYHEVITNNQHLSDFLLSSIENMFRKLSLSIKDIDQIIVANGPGSFTGIRIGLAFAKVTAWTLSKKIIPISELAIMSHVKSDKKYLVPLIDARRGYVYASLYNRNGLCLIPDQYIELNHFLEILEQKYSLSEIEFISYDSFDLPVIMPNIDVLSIVTAYGNRPSENPHSVNPNYLKKTEAEEKIG